MELGPNIRLNKHMVKQCLQHYSPAEVIDHYKSIGYSGAAVFQMICRVQTDKALREEKALRKLARENHGT